MLISLILLSASLKGHQITDMISLLSLPLPGDDKVVIKARVFQGAGNRVDDLTQSGPSSQVEDCPSDGTDLPGRNQAGVHRGVPTSP